MLLNGSMPSRWPRKWCKTIGHVFRMQAFKRIKQRKGWNAKSAIQFQLMAQGFLFARDTFCQVGLQPEVVTKTVPFLERNFACPRSKSEKSKLGMQQPVGLGRVDLNHSSFD